MLFVHLGDTNDLFVSHAVIKADEIAFFHGAQVISGLKVADPSPHGATFLQEGFPGIRLGFLLHEPKMLCHALVLNKDESQDNVEREKAGLLSQNSAHFSPN